MMFDLESQQLSPNLFVVTYRWQGERRQIPNPQGYAISRTSRRYSARFLVGSGGAVWLDGDKPADGWTDNEAFTLALQSAT
jgi:hypothetical protein